MKRCLPVTELALIGLMFGGSALAAQNVRRPSSEECAAAATALTRGARDGSGWERLVDCQQIGGKALAAAFRAARTETDIGYLGRLYSAMARVRDPAIFTTTLELMQDPTASVPTRATAILVALTQHDPSLGLPLSRPYEKAVTSSADQRCRLVHLGRGQHRSAAPLPADYLQQLGRVTEQLVASPTTPPLVRAFASCARRVLHPAVAATATPQLGLSYLCGNRFRANNWSDEWVNVSWNVAGTEDRGDLVVPPKGETVFTTERPGATRLLFQGKLVMTEANSGRACTS